MEGGDWRGAVKRKAEGGGDWRVAVKRGGYEVDLRVEYEVDADPQRDH